MPVLTNDVGLRNGAVGNGRDVFQVDRCTVDLLQREISQANKGGGSAVEADVVFGRADLCGATGLDDVLIADGGQNLGGRKTFGLEFLRVEVHHDGTLFATVNSGYDSTGNGHELRSNDVEAVVV